MFKSVSAAMIAALALANAPANAAEVHFSYQPHELETQAGAKALYKRLSKKAKSECAQPGVRPLAHQRAERACAIALTNDLVAKVNDARVDRIHARAMGEIEVAGSR